MSPTPEPESGTEDLILKGSVPIARRLESGITVATLVIPAARSPKTKYTDLQSFIGMPIGDVQDLGTTFIEKIKQFLLAHPHPYKLWNTSALHLGGSWVGRDATSSWKPITATDEYFFDIVTGQAQAKNIGTGLEKETPKEKGKELIRRSNNPVPQTPSLKRPRLDRDQSTDLSKNQFQLEEATQELEEYYQLSKPLVQRIAEVRRSSHNNPC